MKISRFFGMVFILMLVATLIVLDNTAKAADSYILKIQTSVPSASIYYELIERMAKRVDSMSQGRLKVETLPANAVVPVFEILDGVDKGIVNGGQAWTHYWSGKHPAGVLFSAPCAGLGYGLDQMSVMSWLYDGGGNELYQEYFTKILGYNIKGFMCVPMGPEAFGWFKKPFKSLNELRKIKYRSPPGIPSETFKRIGVNAVGIPGVEIVPSAQRGVIDAAEYIAPAEDKLLGMSSIWKNYYLQGLHQAISIGDIYVNLDWWNKLPADLKAIFDTATMSLIADTYNWNVSKNSIALKEMVEKDGVKILDTPDEYYPAYMKATEEIMNKYAEKDAFFKKVLTSMQEWAKLTVPFQNQANGVYYKMGKTALDKGIVGFHTKK